MQLAQRSLSLYVYLLCVLSIRYDDDDDRIAVESHADVWLLAAAWLARFYIDT